MKIKFKTYSEKIEKIEISKESETSVWDMKNRRHNKQSSYENYFDSFQDAKNYLIKKQEDQIKGYERNIQYCKENIDKINLIKE